MTFFNLTGSCSDINPTWFKTFRIKSRSCLVNCFYGWDVFGWDTTKHFAPLARPMREAGLRSNTGSAHTAILNLQHDTAPQHHHHHHHIQSHRNESARLNGDQAAESKAARRRHRAERRITLTSWISKWGLHRHLIWSLSHDRSVWKVWFEKHFQSACCFDVSLDLQILQTTSKKLWVKTAAGGCTKWKEALFLSLYDPRQVTALKTWEQTSVIIQCRKTNIE